MPISQRVLCYLCPVNRCGGTPTRWFVFSPRQKEADTLHQDSAERTGERVRRQQIHYQGQAEKDLGRHQPVGATNHHLVPKQAGQGEEIRRQSQEQCAVA